MDNILQQVFGEGEALAIERAFRAMEIAEAEIDHAMRVAGQREQGVEKIPYIFSMFMAVKPPNGMLEFAPFVYKAHVRELLRRVLDAKRLPLPKGQLQKPTCAEVSMWVSEASQVTPLSRSGALAYASAIRCMASHLEAGEIPVALWDAVQEIEGAATDWEKEKAKELLDYAFRRSVLREEPVVNNPPLMRLESIFSKTKAAQIFEQLGGTGKSQQPQSQPAPQPVQLQLSFAL
ncbi:MAG TPA: hypothetical protein ENJ54_00165 [Chloroflexi bacterium]|nr:hypothetical protein [Chloroflexota bacterium]